MFNVWHVLPFPPRFKGNWKNAHTMLCSNEIEEKHGMCMLTLTWLPQSEVSEIPWLFPWNSLTNWIMMDSTLLSQPSPASTYLFMLSASHVQCASGLIHSIWKYWMKRFIWGTRTFCATGANVEWRSQKLLGGVRRHLPREIFMIGLSKMQFPTFSGSQLVNQKDILRQ